MRKLQGRFFTVMALLLLGVMLAASVAGAQTAPRGQVPTGMPSRLLVGLYETRGKTWMRDSGEPWDVRYCYLPKGWVNNWGWGAADGAYALNFMHESAAAGFLPAVTFYQMYGEPGGGELDFLSKVQTPGTMRGYFSDFLLLMRKAKEFGKPVLVLVEPDGLGTLQQKTGSNPNTYAAIAASGLPELAGVPNTVAGWGQAFLVLRKAVGASNVVLGIHASGWATGKDVPYAQASAPLQPEVDKLVAFLKPMGLGPNATGQTYDVLVGDPLDRDSDYYRLVRGQQRWWDASDSASLSSPSFNRYAEWLRLINLATGKRWVLWQIPLGNSNHLNIHNAGSGARQGYKDNRTEYFFGASGDAHRRKFAGVGVVALLFGAGVDGQATQGNDQGADGQLYMKTRAGAFLRAGGLSLTAGSTPPPTPTATSFQATPSASPLSVRPGRTVTLAATVTNAGAAVTGATVTLEVYNASGTRVAQRAHTGQAFSSNQTASYKWYWTAPSTTGTYTVKVAVTGAGGAPVYPVTNAAASLKVAW
jgi:hypothetical protein